MEEKFNEATPQRPKGDRTLDASMVTIDLPAFIKQLKEEESYKDSDRNSITVFHTDGMRIVLIALHAGAEMKKHKSEGIISIQVLDGLMEFKTDARGTKLSTGNMVTLHENIPHSVLAVEDTTFLLTMAVGTKIRKQ